MTGDALEAAAAAAALLGTGNATGLPFLRECFAFTDDFLTVMDLVEVDFFVLPMFSSALMMVAEGKDERMHKQEYEGFSLCM